MGCREMPGADPGWEHAPDPEPDADPAYTVETRDKGKSLRCWVRAKSRLIATDCELGDPGPTGSGRGPRRRRSGAPGLRRIILTGAAGPFAKVAPDRSGTSLNREFIRKHGIPARLTNAVWVSPGLGNRLGTFANGVAPGLAVGEKPGQRQPIRIPRQPGIHGSTARRPVGKSRPVVAGARPVCSPPGSTFPQVWKPRPQPRPLTESLSNQREVRQFALAKLPSTEGV